MDVRCINWFESHGENRFLYLKSRCRNGETVFIRFPHYFYYVVTDEIYQSLSPPPFNARPMGKMRTIDIDETISYNLDIKDRKCSVADMWLIEEPKKRSIQNATMDEFFNISWFYISNGISPDGCYSLDEQYLTKINNGCYHCDDPRNCFAKEIPRFDIPRSYLFLDIECHFDKKFPSVFINPISHTSYCYIDLSGKRLLFTLINEEMLTEQEIQEAVDRGCLRIQSLMEMDYERELVLCSEIVLLQIAKQLLELTFDYVVTFNGHNFDLRYITNRLELLTGEKIIFRSPDKKEAVHLCIYERNQSSHKGVCGMANTTFHVNNNNGTIFFDLYSFIQKSEKLDSYKLDSISKNAFSCMGKVLNRGVREMTFIGDDTTDAKGKADTFAKVLTTGNYVTVDEDIICKVIRKDILENGFKVVLSCPTLPNDIYKLSFGKDDIDLAQMYKDYNLNIALDMARYCIHDACLCQYLWEYYGVETKTDAGAATYVLPQSMVFEYRASTIIKGPLLKLLLETKTILVRSETKQKFPYEGGKVFAPKQKMFSNNVLIFDYNSLYPNVCIFGNLSPETLVGVVVSTNRLEEEINNQLLLQKYPPPRYITVHCEPRLPNLISEIAIFDRSIEGTIPRLLRTFLAERARYKKMLKQATSSTEKAIYDSMQYTYKIVANSVYGLMGFRNSALYSYASAKSCTSIGRRMILYLESVLNGAELSNGMLRFANTLSNPFYMDDRDINPIVKTSLPIDYRFRFRSVYGDTDSVFTEIDSQDVDKSIEIAKELERLINSRVLFNNFKIEFEAVYKNLIMQSKKKYTTMKYSASSNSKSVPERINKGTSETRRDVSKFHKNMIKTYKTRLSEMLSEGRMNSNQVCIDILRSLETDLRSEFDSRSSPLELFMLSRMHHSNYKSADNPNMYLVTEYNKNNPETIELGERYYFAYICPANVPWTKKLVNIKTYETIIDRSFKLGSNQRIFYEVYFKRLTSEIVNLLDNKVLCISFFQRMFGSRPTFYEA
ncbi:DNA polymerase (2) [Monkeypox virus]|nr:DNA polymerase (2) [Monkeypox virus]WCC69166.1 DNA polymerase (2) [Monkeypox virus]WDR50495.1 DNA polymerase (2) [Monkeypox virus]WDR54350.1 DNA polymerase (2) [Monkeypox virus]